MHDFTPSVMGYVCFGLASSTEACSSDPEPDVAARRAALIRFEGMGSLVQRRANILGPRALSRVEVRPRRY